MESAKASRNPGAGGDYDDTGANEVHLLQCNGGISGSVHLELPDSEDMAGSRRAGSRHGRKDSQKDKRVL